MIGLTKPMPFQELMLALFRRHSNDDLGGSFVSYSLFLHGVASEAVSNNVTWEKEFEINYLKLVRVVYENLLRTQNELHPILFNTTCPRTFQS